MLPINKHLQSNDQRTNAQPLDKHEEINTLSIGCAVAVGKKYGFLWCLIFNNKK